jgi:uroporphyrinogen decarboxylase
MDWHVSFLNFQSETGITSGFTASPYVPPFRRRVLAEEGEHVVVRTRRGVVQRELRDHPERSMPQFLKYPVGSRKDWAAIKRRLDPDAPGRYPTDWSDLERLDRERDFPIGMPITGAFGHPRNLFGTEGLLTLYYDDPGLLEDVQRHWVWTYKRIVDVVTSHLHLDYVLFWEDMAYKTAPLISPGLFRRFMSPYYRDLVEHIRGKGIDLVFVDTDGQFDVLLPLFLEAGVNGFFPFEVAAGMDVVEVRRKYGPTFAMFGGLDKRALAVGREAIDAELDAKVPRLLEQGGYFPGLDHSAPPDIPLASFVYYLNRLRAIGDRVYGTTTPPLPDPRPRRAWHPPSEGLPSETE